MDGMRCQEDRELMPVVNNVLAACKKEPSQPQNSLALGQDAIEISRMVKHLSAVDDVHRVVRQRYRLTDSVAYFDVRMVSQAGHRAPAHLIALIGLYGDNVARTCRGERERSDPRSSTQVQQGRAAEPRTDNLQHLVKLGGRLEAAEGVGHVAPEVGIAYDVSVARILP
jgi:hypothetical protein